MYLHGNRVRGNHNCLIRIHDCVSRDWRSMDAWRRISSPKGDMARSLLSLLSPLDFAVRSEIGDRYVEHTGCDRSPRQSRWSTISQVSEVLIDARWRPREVACVPGSAAYA